MTRLYEVSTQGGEEFNMLNASTDLSTMQQEIALDEYSKEGCEIPFWEWYAIWCYENSCYNDRAIYEHGISIKATGAK